MRNWMTFLSRLIAILLVLNMSMDFGLPSGDRLLLCLGSDGHIDISFIAGSKFSPNIQKNDTRLSNKTKHHGDCVDIEIIYDTFEDIQLTSPEVDSRKLKQAKSDSSQAFDSAIFSPYISENLIGKTSPSVPKEFYSSSHLVFLCTILLQV